MAYWVVLETATGRLHSRGDTDEPQNLPAGLEAKSFVSKPLDTEEWDESTKAWRAMTMTTPRDLIQDLVADVQADGLLSSLNAAQKNRLRDLVINRFGRFRFDG